LRRDGWPIDGSDDANLIGRDVVAMTESICAIA
jgi:hypothetical protein